MLFSATSNTPVWARLFVDQSVPSSGDGSTWVAAFQTIGEALTAATTQNNEIWVAKGIYHENLSISKTVYLYGGFSLEDMIVEDRDLVNNSSIIEGDGTISVIRWDDSEFGRIDGFTITGGRAFQGGGISIQNHIEPSFPNINHQIVNCIIEHNEAIMFGGGIAINFGVVEILESTVRHNRAGEDGGGIFSQYRFTLKQSLVFDNECTRGGGVFCGAGQITQCRIWGNRAGHGGGIAFENVSSGLIIEPELSDSSICGNLATSSGGGVSLNDAAIRIKSCVIAGNWANSGGGILIQDSDESRVENSFIAGNTGVFAGGGIGVVVGSTHLILNTLAFNDSPRGGGVSCNGSPMMRNLLFSRNTGHAIFEGDATQDAALISNCFFHSNANGLILDESSTSITDLGIFNSLPECNNNSEGEAKFKMDTASAASGAWNAPAIWDGRVLTVLTATPGSFSQSFLLGRLIQPDIAASNRIAVIVSNDNSTITIVDPNGSFAAIADAGDSFKFVDLHLSSYSDAIDVGEFTLLPLDIDGEARGFDGNGLGPGPGGDGSDTDAGADEMRQLNSTDSWILYQ